MADIVARLRLDNKDYEDKLAKAKKSTKNFSQEGGAGLSDMMGKFKALGAAVAASKAVMETFNAVIASSQTIGDAYTQAMEGAKGAVNEFVYSIANADFSGFNGGLKGIISNAKDAAAAMDALGNAQISYDYLTAGYKSSFKTNMGTAKDKSKNLTERQAAYEAAMGDLGKIKNAVDGYTAKVIDAVVDNAKSKGNNINKDFITRENIDRIMALDISANGDEEKKALAERYEEFKKLSSEAKNLNDIIKRGEKWGKDVSEYKARLEEINAITTSDDMQMAALYNAMLVKGTDEWLKGLTGLLIKADNANAAYQELKTSSLEVAQNIGRAAAEQTKQAQAAAAAAQATANIHSNIAANNPANATMAGLPQGSTASALPATIAMPEAVTESTQNLEAMTEQTYTAVDAMNALGSTMGSLSSIIGEDAAAWLDWGAGVMSAVASAIPAIGALTAAKTTEATANTASAATGAASSVASIPGVGPIMAVAAVASVLAALANLPKFATGGIVPGTSFSGDNVLIRANSGEVVLNREQQHILSQRLNGGMNGKVVFKIEGSTLVGVLNNNQKIASRSYGG